MNARERAEDVARRYISGDKTTLIWLVEGAITAAEEEATKKERARSLELIKRCQVMYERLSFKERQSVIDVGKSVGDPFSPFYRNSAEQTYSDRAMGCEYAEMVVREVDIDLNRMPVPF